MFPREFYLRIQIPLISFTKEWYFDTAWNFVQLLPVFLILEEIFARKGNLEIENKSTSDFPYLRCPFSEVSLKTPLKPKTNHKIYNIHHHFKLRSNNFFHMSAIFWKSSLICLNSARDFSLEQSISFILFEIFNF